MKRKRLIVKNRKRKKVYLSIFVSLLFLFGVGYATRNSNLGIFGNLKVASYNCDKKDKTLYSVLENEAVCDKIYAKEYMGEHQDSMAGVGSKKIYHYYAENDADGSAILNMNNVIFAGHCWQMIRTTDTGGVKMIYNGETENNQCLDTRGTHIGYARQTSQNLNSNYWYGTSYKYDSTTKMFQLSGDTEQQTWNEKTGPDLIGKYTCNSSNVDGECQTLYLVESYKSATYAYVIPLNSTSHYSQFGELQFNYDDDSLSNVGYMYNKTYLISLSSKSSSTAIIKYSEGFNYSNGTYQLDGESVSFSDFKANNTRLTNAHYTCWNENGECTTLSYVFHISSSTWAYWINLKDGKDIDEALYEMLYDNNVNAIDSTMKFVVESWYKKYLNDYDSYIEDTIFCNNRSISAFGGWKPNGGLFGNLFFKNYTTNTDLSCSNKTDQFSISNSIAQLKYKVGLMSAPEMFLLNQSTIRKTGKYYWLISPYGLDGNRSNGRVVHTNGSVISSDRLTIASVSSTAGVRPAISLKPGTEYTTGDGSTTNPYVIKTS